MARKKAKRNVMAMYRKFLARNLAEDERAFEGLAQEQGVTVDEVRAQFQTFKSGCDPAMQEAAAKNQARDRARRFWRWFRKRSRTS